MTVSELEEIKNAIIKILDKKIVFNNLRDIAIDNYSWERIIENTEKDFEEIQNRYKE